MTLESKYVFSQSVNAFLAAFTTNSPIQGDVSQAADLSAELLTAHCQAKPVGERETSEIGTKRRTGPQAE